MSQITRCPACATQFKVASDQLRASEGWVRCGQCDEIFDAVAHLVPLDAFPVLSQVVPAHRREPVPEASAPASPPVPGPAPAPLAPPAPAEPAPLPPAPAEPAAVAPEPEPESDPLPEPESEPSPIDDFASQLRQALDFPPPLPVAAESESDDGPPAPESEEPAEDEVPAIELDFPSFAPADDAPEAAQAWEPGPGAAPAAPGEDALDSAVDAGVLGAKLAFPDDARHPAQAEETDLLADRIAAEMDEVVLHLHESAEEPPVPDWMAQASAVADAPAAAPAPDRAEPASPMAQAGTLPPMAMPPLGDDGGGEQAPAQPEGDVEEASAPEDNTATAPAVAAAAAALAAAAAATVPPGPASGPSVWERLGVRLALGGASLVLVLGLLAQAAVQWREPLLVASNGRALPGLQALCVPFQCTLAAPRGVTDLVIDASGFRHLQDDRYELSLALQNRAKAPLAMPALELTLTDAKDQALVRRVLQPADLGAPAELPAGKRWEATVPVVLAAPDVSVASYRLLAFYP